MDKFKEKTIKEYISWDINCPFVCRKRSTKKKLITIFKRRARRILKQELKHEEVNI